MNDATFKSLARAKINRTARIARNRQVQRYAIHRYVKSLLPQHAPPMQRMPEHGRGWAQ